MQDVRCLCGCCRNDYEAAGYTVSPVSPIKHEPCYKCGRNGTVVTIRKVEKKRRIVFVCSAYGGDEENQRRAEEYCTREVAAGNIPFAPHVYFPRFMSEKTDRERGILFGLIFLAFCDEIHVYGDLTNGMRREIRRAIELGIRVVYMEAK